MNVRPWLEDVSWDLVVWQNLQLCNDKHAHHGATSDGHAPCRALWESSRHDVMSLSDLVNLCRKCHRLAPFTNYNGNTFAAIARTMIEQLTVAPSQIALARSLAGHIVAGVASDEEIRAFEEFCNSLG